MNQKRHITETKALHSPNYLKSHYNLTSLRKYSKKDILQILDDYFVLMVVRHPLDRIISAYRDKLAGNNSIYEHRLGRSVLKAVRPQASDTVKQRGHGVTFQEFIQYMIQTEYDNGHFTYYQSLCHPCLIQYDYIAKLETQYTDASYIINKYLAGYGADGLSNLHSNRGGASQWKALSEYDSLSPEELDTFIAMYTPDINMFGYRVHERNKTTHGSCGYNVFQPGCC
jgi:hypothetical protein